MSELNKEELLEILHAAFTYHAPDGEAKKSNQAYNQIVALIKKPEAGISPRLEYDDDGNVVEMGISGGPEQKLGKLPQKRGMKIDEIISRFPEPVRILMNELVEQIEELKKKPKISKEFIGKVVARIYCDRRSTKAIKTHVREAFEKAGVEVVDK